MMLIYIYVGLSVYCCLSVLFICVYVCETQQSHSVTKVPRLEIYSFIISLSEITHQMWGREEGRGVFITCQLWPIKSCSGKRMFWLFWQSWKNPWKDFRRSSLLVKLQARSQLFNKKWTQSQLFFKNFAWNFQNTFFREYIWVAASWNYIIVSSVLQRYSKTLIYIWTQFY